MNKNITTTVFFLCVTFSSLSLNGMEQNEQQCIVSLIQNLKDKTLDPNNQSHLSLFEQAVKECIKNNDAISLTTIEYLSYENYSDVHFLLSQETREKCNIFIRNNYNQSQSKRLKSLDKQQQETKDNVQKFAQELKDLIASHQESLNNIQNKLSNKTGKKIIREEQDYTITNYLITLCNRGGGIHRDNNQTPEYQLLPTNTMLDTQTLLQKKHAEITKEITDFHNVIGHLIKEANRIENINK